jgi:CysZ protein
MLGELRRIGYLGKWMLGLLIVSMIPGLNLLAPVLWAAFGAWGCALEFFAYPLENKGLLFPAQKILVGRVRLGALSFGGLVLVGLGVPFLNLLVAPAAVIAATLYVQGMDETENLAS